MRWPGVAHRSNKSDIDVKHLSHLADTIARKILFTFRLFQLRKMFCISDRMNRKEPCETFYLYSILLGFTLKNLDYVLPEYDLFCKLWSMG